MSKHGGVGSYHSAAERCQPSSVRAQIPATNFPNHRRQGPASLAAK